jgi:hypothetical protein
VATALAPGVDVVAVVATRPVRSGVAVVDD